jgi:prevent-host-death family protein
MDRVGVRELKQNASAVLRRVTAGEALEVTDRGRPVALLIPVPKEGSVRDRLIAEGQLTPASESWDDLPPAIRLPKGRRLPSEILTEMRDEDER